MDVTESATIDKNDENIREANEENYRVNSEDEYNDFDLLLEERERDGSTAEASQSNLSGSSKLKEQKMWYEQLVLTYFEFSKTLKKKKKLNQGK